MIDEEWRAQYRQRRYLLDLSDPDLRQRGRDTFQNLMTIDKAGKAAALPLGHEGHAFWRMRFVHFLEESALRFGPYPNGLGNDFATGLRFPDPRSPRVKAALAAVNLDRLQYGKYLVKYGRREHLEKTLKRGIVRIAPASAFADPALNHAIQDNELEFSFMLHRPSDSELEPYFTEKSLEPLVVDGTVVIAETARENFYLYCLSASYEPRLFDDFNADSCLIIWKPMAFRDRLMWGVHERIQARGHAFLRVAYVDPLTETGKDVNISFKKHARYQYQNEMRGIWLSKTPTEPLEVQFVEIGKLSDIAELVTI